jgi:hypothetical protein
MAAENKYHLIAQNPVDKYILQYVYMIGKLKNTTEKSSNKHTYVPANSIPPSSAIAVSITIIIITFFVL